MWVNVSAPAGSADPRRFDCGLALPTYMIMRTLRDSQVTGDYDSVAMLRKPLRSVLSFGMRKQGHAWPVNSPASFIQHANLYREFAK